LATLPKYLTTAQAAEYCNIKVKTLERHRQNGTGPPYIKVGPRIIRYRREDLDAWMEAGLCWTKDLCPA
jgi:excisionase family DNA binding protein